MPDSTIQAYRAALYHQLDDPGLEAQPRAGTVEYYADGMLVVEDGQVRDLGPAEAVAARLPDGVEVEHWPDHLLIPGLIDSHVHMPQLDVIASYGTQLLQWLQTYTFPAEARFADAAFAHEAAGAFLDELLRNGTTSAMVFCTVHGASAESFFQAACARRLCMIAGKVMMDRNAPANLLDTLASSEQDSRRLIEHWHGRDRLHYAITPRFAPTSSERQLRLAGALLAEYPGLYLQTHLAENQAEVAWVAELFPQARDYLEVYERFALVGPRSVFAHCIHISDDARQRMARAGAAAAFCPGSNNFLGSGLFDLAAGWQANLPVSLASDVGGGTSLSMFATMAEAYKVTQLRGHSLAPAQAFYLATLGSARALHLEDRMGNLPREPTRISCWWIWPQPRCWRVRPLWRKNRKTTSSISCSWATIAPSAVPRAPATACTTGTAPERDPLLH